jgi:flagellar protein FliO/FliZ
MTNSILLSRAVATATVLIGACLLACTLASSASAYHPASSAGSENTPLDLNASTGSTHTSAGSGGASLVRTIVGLAIVIAVIWGLAWILKQVKASRGGESANRSDGLVSVATLALGSNRSVHLVRAGSDYVLLGSTEHGVAPIHRYTEEQAREVGLLAGGRRDSGPEAREAGLLARGHRAPSPVARGRRDPSPATGGSHDPSPALGARPDPMRMPSPGSGVVERLRELTVRR